VKVFDKLNYQADQWEYVHREIDILQTLTTAQRNDSHSAMSYVIEIYDVVETSQFLYLFMELGGMLMLLTI